MPPPFFDHRCCGNAALSGKRSIDAKPFSPRCIVSHSGSALVEIARNPNHLPNTFNAAGGFSI
jgi:hypothetical protein